MERRRSGIFIPILIIAIGVIALLANLNVLNPQALANLAVLWPLVLIVVGLWIAFSRLLPPRTATLANVAVLVTAIVIAVAFAAAGGVGQRQALADSAAPLGGLSTASFDLGSGAVGANVTAQDLGDVLYRAHLEYPAGDQAPSVSVDRGAGVVRIQFGDSRGGPFFFGGGRRHVDLTLNSKVAWAATVHGGASNLTIDLSSGQLRSLDVSGGASHVDATLGAPHGTVTLAINGGASNFDVHLPDGTQWHALVNGGPSSLEVDGSSSGGFGNLERKSDGYDAASDRYDIQVNGGASKVSIETG